MFAAMAKRKDSSVILENRKARFLYFLSDFVVAGLVLTGTEIKSLRAGNASLADSYVYIKDGEAYIANFHIAPYHEGTLWNVDHLRDRKLLLHRREIAKLERETKGTGMTIVPVKVFLSRGFAKVEIALAKGKKLHDKREAIKEADAKRKIDRAVRHGGTGDE